MQRQSVFCSEKESLHKETNRERCGLQVSFADDEDECSEFLQKTFR